MSAKRGSTLCLCNTNHPAGPRIRKQDQWELEGHGQYVPPRLPPPQASISYATYGISYATILHTTSKHYIVCFRRCESRTSEPSVRHRIIPMLHYTSYATSPKKRTISYVMSYVKMARPCKKRTTSYLFCRYHTLYIQCLTKSIRHRIRHRIRHSTS
jgi:hypothetical protein